MDELTPWWTVCGVWPATRERWNDHYQALTPRLAEDLARLDAKQRGGELWVTNVFPGRLQAADDYATFVDPDAIPDEYGQPT